jgi:hypothetical protein
MNRVMTRAGQRVFCRWTAALCAGAWLFACTAGSRAETAQPGDPAAALCAEAEAAPDGDTLAALEAALDERLGLDHGAYEAAARRRDAAEGAYFGLLRKLADTIQARMAEAWTAARAAETAFANAPAGEAGAAARAAAQADMDSAKATLDDLSTQFAATPAEQALAIGGDMVAEYDAAVVEQTAAAEALAAVEAERGPLLVAQRTATQCIADRRQALLAEEQARKRAAMVWVGEGGYLATCRNAAFNHKGQVRLTGRADGGLEVALFVPRERGGGVVSLQGTLDAAGRVAVAQSLGGVMWMLDGTLVEPAAQPARLQGGGSGRFANPLQGLDCTVQWQTSP